MSADVMQRVRRVFAEALELNVGESEIETAERADQLQGLDSIALVEFVLALEREFGITLDGDSLDPDLIRDLERLSRHISGLLDAR